MKKPTVSIGMPVYNGEPFIREAIDSLLAQNFTDFELIISDNASTDGTEAICLEYAAKDMRIQYVRQAKNLGALGNFQFVLDKSVGEYFMWAAADDVRSRNFLESNLFFLRKNPQYVGSISPVRFDGGEQNSIVMGDGSLEGELNDRLLAFFSSWHANARFYSLFRKSALIDVSLLDFDFFAGDWAFSLLMLQRGKLKRIESGELILGKSGESNTSNVFKKYNTNAVNFFIPFNRLFTFTNSLFVNPDIQLRIKLYLRWFSLSFSALKLNVKWKVIGRKVS